MVTHLTPLSRSAKRKALARLHGRYERAGRPHQSRLLDEFCATCGYHRQAALRLLHRPRRTAPPKRSGPKLLYEPAEVRPVLKAIWLASDPWCSKLLKAALPEWLEPHPRRPTPLPEAFREQLLKSSPAPIDRLRQPAGHHAARLRPRPTRSRIATTARRGSRGIPLTFTELYSGGTENRAVWNKSADSVLVELPGLAQVGPYAMQDFHTDNGGGFLNWALPRHLIGRAAKLPWTRRRAYRKNDHAHCEQKHWTHVRQLFGHDRFGPAALVPLMNDLYAGEGSQFTNHFKPTFKLLQREKKNGKTKRIYEKTPCTPYQRLLDSPEIPEATKVKLRAEHVALDPFALKKSSEVKLKRFFTALGDLDRESTKT